MDMHKQRDIISTQNPYGYFQMVDADRGRCAESWHGMDSTKELKKWNIEDCFVFPLMCPQEVIVKPQEVPELLKLILSKQEPQVKAALDNQRRREARGAVDKALTTRSHAQIISVGD